MKYRKHTLFIRIDGNKIIGMGHVMRCLSIADQLKNLPVDINFVTADENVTGFIKDKGYNSICLNSAWNDMEQELPLLEEIIDAYKADVILVDSYYVTEYYLRVLKKHVKLYYIDDLNRIEYPVDALINYNIYGEECDYGQYDNRKLYLGTTYVPLRYEFMNKHTRTYKGLNSILITSGGTDQYNVVGNILETMKQENEFNSLEFYCIMGKFNRNTSDLREKFHDCDNIHFLIDINNMAEYMCKCDVAITAGGSTCYELCACGLPAIIYTLADNQIGIANSFSRKGIAPWVGDVRTEMSQCMNNIKKEIKILREACIWEQRSEKMQKLVDGKGAKRLAKILASYSENEI